MLRGYLAEGSFIYEIRAYRSGSVIESLQGGGKGRVRQATGAPCHYWQNAPVVNRNSDRQPRHLRRGWRVNWKSIVIPYGEDSPRLATGKVQSM